MTRVGLRGRAAVIATMAVCALLAACGDDGVGSSDAQTANLQQPTFPFGGSGSASLQINGSPQKSAAVGQAYTFQPSVFNVTGANLQFSIRNTPAWARFDPASGTLSGTPSASQVGTYANITISATAAQNTASLPAFTIVVGEGNPQGGVTLSWDAPTENADGSPLVDLKGYKVHYGPASKSYSNTIQVPNAGVTTYVVDDLPAGSYYFAVTAYNSDGKESSLSPEISTQVD